MSDQEDKRLYDHFTSLIAGSHSSGNSVANQLIVSDAKRHLADLVSKHPILGVKEEPKEEQKVETKPKVKK